MLYPFHFVFGGLRWLISKIFRAAPDDKITEDEILTVVEEAEEDGTLRDDETRLIRSVIEFDDLEAIDIMTPRVDVEAVDKTSTVQEIADLFTETGFSRLPVYEETIDSIVGIINEKDFHNLVLRDGNAVKQIIKPVEFIPPSMKISALLKLLQQNKSHLAVIVDEFGGTEGIVTLEDIIEELVGEIWDEHDEVVEAFQKVSDNEYLVDCSTNLDELLEYFHLKSDSEASTINGWVIEQLDRIPEKGDCFDFENLHVVVEETEYQRATRVRITVSPKKEESEEA